MADPTSVETPTDNFQTLLKKLVEIEDPNSEAAQYEIADLMIRCFKTGDKNIYRTFLIRLYNNPTLQTTLLNTLNHLKTYNPEGYNYLLNEFQKVLRLQDPSLPFYIKQIIEFPPFGVSEA